MKKEIDKIQLKTIIVISDNKIKVNPIIYLPTKLQD